MMEFTEYQSIIGRQYVKWWITFEVQESIWWNIQISVINFFRDKAISQLYAYNVLIDNHMFKSVMK